MDSTEFSQTLSQFTKTQKLGEGTYGEVFGGIDNETGDKVALKQVRLDEEEDGIPFAKLREIVILKGVNHPNIIALKSVAVARRRVILVFEFMDRSLAAFVAGPRPFSPELLLSYSFQLLAGIAYLHSNRVIHRDLTPHNVLLNIQGFLKISDFSKARHFSIPVSQMTPVKRKVAYLAPEELVHADTYGLPVDIWSAGCIIAEMVRRRPLFAGDSDIDQLMRIFHVLGTPNEQNWPNWASKMDHTYLPKCEAQDLGTFITDANPQLLDLIRKMLVFNPEDRITALEALKHPCFGELAKGVMGELCLSGIM